VITGPKAFVRRAVQSRSKALLYIGYLVLWQVGYAVFKYKIGHFTLREKSAWTLVNIPIVEAVAFNVLYSIFTDQTRPSYRLKSLVIAIGVTLFQYAGNYVALSYDGQFHGGNPLDFVQAFYFAATTMTTTGYGDIYASGDFARVVVTAQMLTDLVLLAFALNLLVQYRRNIASKDAN
jgi:hypothetical protein